MPSDLDKSGSLLEMEKVYKGPTLGWFMEFDDIATLDITRIQIPFSTITPTTIFMSSGYYTTGDLGTGAIYTSIGADANSFMAIQDASGTWFKLVTSNGPVNLGWLGYVGDGVTDNSAVGLNLSLTSPKLSLSNPQSGILISIGSPATFTLTAHGFVAGTPIQFSTTGTLPTGLVAGQTYWVRLTNLTDDSFEVTDTSPRIEHEDTALPINTSGTQSGVHSVIRQGDDWINIYIPPGDYVQSTLNRPFTNNGNRKVIVNAYGARSTGLWFDNNTNIIDDTDNTFLNVAPIKTQGMQSNISSVTLTNLADTAKFHPNQWALIMALDIQGPLSWPPNYYYFEYRKITSVNAGTGVVTFANVTRNSYKSTFPGYGPIVISPTQSFPPFGPGGAALMVAMSVCWDCEIVIRGLRMEDAGQTFFPAKSCRIEDCYFSGDGHIPTVNKVYIVERCVFAEGATIEVDKLNEYIHYIDCIIPSIISIPSASNDRFVVEGCDIGIIQGTAKLMEIYDSNIGALFLGPLGGFGATEGVLIENSRINTMQKSITFGERSDISGTFNLVENWTWSGGTISKPLTAGVVSWAVPGSKGYVRPYDDSTLVDNMGAPFAVTNVYTDGVNTLIDTTLAAKPVGDSTNSVVTITIASPAEINWTAHGLSADTPVAFLTTGALPTGIGSGVYYVLAAGLGLDKFQISTTKGGAAVNTSGTQSGTHTAISNPLILVSHSCPRITVKNCTGGVLISSMNGHPDGAPLFSYFKRLYVNDSGSIAGAGQANVTSPYVWGNLISLTVNVIRAYTGATNPLTLAITAQAFDSGLLASNLSQTIDLRTAGIRVITADGVSGSAGVDSLTAFGDWISGKILFEFSADIANGPTSPIFEVEVYTDQGITRYNVIQYYDDDFGIPTTLSDNTYRAL